MQKKCNDFFIIKLFAINKIHFHNIHATFSPFLLTQISCICYVNATLHFLNKEYFQ